VLPYAISVSKKGELNLQRKRVVELTKEEIEATLERYEQAVAAEKPPWSQNRKQICIICRNPERAVINRILLEGTLPYNTLRRNFDLDLPQMYRHWERHLAPCIDPELSRRTVLSQVDRIEAHKQFPTAPHLQYNWIIRQLLVARNLLLLELEAGMPLRLPNSGAIPEYLDILMKIKDLIPFSHLQKKLPVGRPTAEPVVEVVDDEITPEQEDEILRAKQKRLERQRRMEDHDGTGTNIRYDKPSAGRVGQTEQGPEKPAR